MYQLNYLLRLDQISEHKPKIVEGVTEFVNYIVSYDHLQVM